MGLQLLSGQQLSIAFLSPSVSRESGGIFEVERRLAQCLNMLPYVKVEVFGTLDRAYREDGVAWAPVAVQAFPYYGPGQFRWSPALNRAFQSCGADVAHLHALWMHMSIIVRAWASRYAKPYLTTLHGMLDDWALRNSAWKKRISGMVYERDCLAKAACIQVFSESELASARAYGLKNPICILPNGVDLPGPVSAGAPWADEVHNGTRILLYLGRLHPKKGLLNLLRAWKSVVADCTVADDWCLVIAGWDQSGHERQLKRLTATFDLERTVHFAGPLFGEAKAAAFQHADAFVLPSFSEGLPMVVLEAWSYGKPVVMTPQCNLAEGFAAGAAISVQPDPINIADGLRQLMAAHDSERAAIGARGRELVQKRFAWPQIAVQMHDVYSWLVGGGAAPACVIQ